MRCWYCALTEGRHALDCVVVFREWMRVFNHPQARAAVTHPTSLTPEEFAGGYRIRGAIEG